MHPLGIDRDWWVPLERFIAPERRLLSFLLVLSLVVHGVGMALVGGKGVQDGGLSFGGPSVILLPAGEVVGAGPEALALSLRLDDPSAIALPRLASLFSHAVAPGVETAPLGPAEAENLIGMRQALPAGVGGLAEMAERMPSGRPQLGTPRVAGTGFAAVGGRVLVGSGLAGRLVGGPKRLDPVRTEGRMEGPTVVSAGVDAEGMVREAVVVGSCGVPDQDVEALRMVRDLRFAPAPKDHGVVWSPVAFYWAEADPAPGEGP
jgi:TonB family protein